MLDTRTTPRGVLAHLAPAMLTLLMVRMVLPYLGGTRRLVAVLDESFPLYVLLLVATKGLLGGARWGYGRLRRRVARDNPALVSSGSATKRSAHHHPSPLLQDLFTGQMLVLVVLLLRLPGGGRGLAAVPVWFLALSAGMTGIAMVGLLHPPSGPDDDTIR
jgi:hypothetical protein